MSIDQAALKSKKPGFRPGVSVKNGKLYAFSEVRAVVVRGWPEMSAWTKTYRRPQWSRFRPKIDFSEGIIEATRSRHRFRPDRPILEDEPSPELPEAGPQLEFPDLDNPAALEMKKLREEFEKEKQLVREYLGNVPVEVRNAIAPFQSRQWHLCAMAARCQGSLDLITSNPALAYCLASSWAFTPYPSKAAMRLSRRLIGLRRRSICGVLGFPESEASVSVLSKIPASSCCIPWLLTIRALLRDPDWRKTLLHLPSLNPAVMLFLGNKAFRRRTAPHLLHELSGDPTNLFRQMVGLMSMEKVLGEQGPSRFCSVDQILRHVLDLLWRIHGPEHSAKAQESGKDLLFPKTPIPGSDSIIALENFDLLSEEAREQQNCVVNYRDHIAAGGMFFYRVLEPERATLSIVSNAAGEWRLDELLGARNTPVSDETRQSVARWIKGRSNKAQQMHLRDFL